MSRDHSLSSVRRIGNLGEWASIRIAADDGYRVVLDSGEGTTQRCAIIDLATGSLSRIEASPNAGTRTARTLSVKNPKGVAKAPMLVWQDPDGQSFEALVPNGEWVFRTACPPNSRAVFVGTRRNEREGNGRLYCFWRGDLRWTFDPPHSARRFVFSTGQFEMVKAFPCQIAVQPDGSYVAVSFAHYIYFIDKYGNARSVHSWFDLRKGLSNETFADARILDDEGCGGHVFQGTGSEGFYGGHEDAEGADWRVETEIDSDPQQWPPEIGQIAMAADSGIWIVSVRNVLLWFTREGHLVQAKQLNIGALDGSEYLGPVTRLFVSASGRTIIAHVPGHGIALVRDGIRVVSRRGECFRWGGPAVNEETGLVAFWSGKEIRLFDLEFGDVVRLEVPAVVRGLQWACGGRLLIVNGVPHPILLLHYDGSSGGPVQYESSAVEGGEQFVDAATTLLNPAWMIQGPGCGYGEYHLLSDDGTMVYLRRYWPDGLDIYSHGLLTRSERNRSVARSIWKSQMRVASQRKATNLPRAKSDGRTLRYFGLGTKRTAWKYIAKWAIRKTSVSPSGNYVSLLVGNTLLVLLNSSGEVQRVLRTSAVDAVADDLGGCLIFTRLPFHRMERLESDGSVTTICRFSEDVQFVQNRGEHVAFVTSDGHEHRVWLTSLTGRTLFNWPTGGKNTLVEWAACAPVLLVTDNDFHAAFDLRCLDERAYAPPK